MEEHEEREEYITEIAVEPPTPQYGGIYENTCKPSFQ